ncbi:MAG: hypothetical protein M0011_07045 [Elusimicrobia bacterium]|nr:hypothetical protein [Elusimicrobiota bacterium]
MKDIKLAALLALLPALWGCASFNSGDMLVDRKTAGAMLEDKELVPFSALEVSWRNYPYRAPTDSIGEGSVSHTNRVMPVQVDPGDEAAFRRKAEEIFAKAGLLDKVRGKGNLRLELTSFGRWTYGDLFRSFLVDTGFVFIIPASLRVNYYLTADFAVSSGTVRVETEARNKTTFHLLLAPLYPFFSPGARENGLLRQMLWRSATDVYSKLKAAGSAPAVLQPKKAEEEGQRPLSGPPVEPDRSWLPGQPLGPAPQPAEAPAAVPAQPQQQAAPAAAPSAQPAAPPQAPPPSAGPAEPLDD